MAEIFLRKIFVDDALEDWCKQCSFRLATVNVKKPFKDAVEEEKAFAQAIIANYWINRPPILVRSVPVIPVPNVPPKLKKDSKLAKSIC